MTDEQIKADVEAVGRRLADGTKETPLKVLEGRRRACGASYELLSYLTGYNRETLRRSMRTGKLSRTFRSPGQWRKTADGIRDALDFLEAQAAARKAYAERGKVYSLP